ncbi:hypothetical protein P280DRAFT_530031 [Massarina eburnea CBS 473.64]|uniref:Uncharacterized protein n=1 Tax=Massarina eburnea CBS 473.64 TaxID=1395130 RepID=A0A6A6RUL6_9PLEO|nr:hypothetical protein P280DRAFT_530031 [Massarina eburnea CBS 473.64]
MEPLAQTTTKITINDANTSPQPTTPYTTPHIYEFETPQVPHDEILRRFCAIIDVINNRVERARMTGLLAIDVSLIISDRETLWKVAESLDAHFGSSMTLGTVKVRHNGLANVDSWRHCEVPPQEYFDVVTPVIEEVRELKALCDMESVEEEEDGDEDVSPVSNPPDIREPVCDLNGVRDSPFAVTPSVLADLDAFWVKFAHTHIPGIPGTERGKACRDLYAVLRHWNRCLQNPPHNEVGYPLTVLMSYVLELESEAMTSIGHELSFLRFSGFIPGPGFSRIMDRYRGRVVSSFTRLTECGVKGFRNDMDAFIVRKGQIWHQRFWKLEWADWERETRGLNLWEYWGGG